MQNVKLIGTDKQVAWAEKIRKEHAFAIRSAKKLMQDIIPRTPEGGKTNMACKAALEKIEAIEAETSAAWWIDNGKMNHDCLMAGSPLRQLSDASVLASIEARIKATIKIVQA
ncbi:hypothetical protein CO615_00005 [Lysobacteraceae bacterium NML75-0749]|nr:hypothetical protein CO615_00005 [Xanthomonadaceae bacterium NML75-0749]